MQIQISSGTGTGLTKLSAFDSALNNAGVANYNLIRLSSIIPPRSEIQIKDGQSVQTTGEWGDKLYVVMAEMRTATPNLEAWAGIGWVQDKQTGAGLFVEHEGANEESVKRDITHSLEALQATRKIDWGEIQMKVVGKTCVHEPVCALVVAVFESESWRTNKAND